MEPVRQLYLGVRGIEGRSRGADCRIPAEYAVSDYKKPHIKIAIKKTLKNILEFYL